MRPQTPSVIIPFFGPKEPLRLCLEALERQTLPPGEVIVVNNGSPCDTGGLRARYSAVTWLEEREVGSYSARNRGLRCSTGNVVAFTDADCIPDPSWLENGIAALNDTGATIVGGRVAYLDPDDRPLNLCEVAEEMFFGLSNQGRLIEIHGFAATANLLAYRAAFERAGPFDPTLRSSGDREWAIRAVRAGESLKYAPAAVVRHPRRSSVTAIVRKARRITGGRIALMRREPRAALSIARDLFQQSVFNPRLYAACLRCPRLCGPARAIGFLMFVQGLSLIVFGEKLRLLAGGSAARS